jgi:hypothetical protein
MIKIVTLTYAEHQLRLGLDKVIIIPAVKSIKSHQGFYT